MTDGVRSVKRALGVIRLMNTRPVWSLAELTDAMALPKTTVFRLLQTLEAEGLVRAMRGSHGLYSLSSSAQELGAGVSMGSVVGEVAANVIIRETQRLRWPLSVGVLDDCYMRVVFCGMPYSQLSAKATTLNKRYWMFTSALGMAYFSFAATAEQQIILERSETILKEHGLDWPFPQSQLDRRVREVRRAGFSTRIANKSDVTSAMALPLRSGEDLLGALVCTTYPKSLTETRVQELYPQLVNVGIEIARKWEVRARSWKLQGS